MAHIVRFKLDGLLGRSKPIEIFLDRHVNVFFGENGCGKTTVLKILQSAMSLNGEAMLSLPISRAEVDIYSISENRILTHIWEQKQSKQSELSLEMLDAIEDPYISSFEKARLLQFRRSVNPWNILGLKRSKSKPLNSWAHSYLPTTRLYSFDTTRRANDHRANAEDKLNEAFAEAVNKRWLLYYNQVLKEVKNIQEEGLRAALYHSLSLTSDHPPRPILDPHQAYVRVKKFLTRQATADARLLGSAKTFAGRYETDNGLRRVVDNINHVEERIESAMASIQRFSETINGMYSRGKRLQPGDNGLEIRLSDGQTISPALLSSGEKHLLTILLQAMTAGENAIIIDEPELSMHIDWQHSLAGTIGMLNPNCQLIVASHSPEIMANIADDKIFRI